jgi:uncharacterized protein YihD (DUF1040 family)
MLNLDVGVCSEVVGVVVANPPRVVDVFPGIADEGRLPRNFGYKKNEFPFIYKYVYSRFGSEGANCLVLYFILHHIEKLTRRGYDTEVIKESVKDLVESYIDECRIKLQGELYDIAARSLSQVLSSVQERINEVVELVEGEYRHDPLDTLVEASTDFISMELHLALYRKGYRGKRPFSIPREFFQERYRGMLSKAKQILRRRLEKAVASGEVKNLQALLESINNVRKKATIAETLPEVIQVMKTEAGKNPEFGRLLGLIEVSAREATGDLGELEPSIIINTAKIPGSKGTPALSIEYNIKSNGDRTLRGTIAELVFKRVYPQLLGRLRCCSTTELAWALRFCNEIVLKDIAIEDINAVILEYVRRLNMAREMLGLEKRSEAVLSNVLSSSTLIRTYLPSRCLLCLDRAIPSNFVETDIKVAVKKNDEDRGVGYHTVHFILCNNCLRIAQEKGYITTYRSYKVIRERNPLFYETVMRLVRLVKILAHYEALSILSKIDDKAKTFLSEVYAWAGSGAHPFDFFCVDEQGGKYLVDVVSTRDYAGELAPLTKREKEVAEEARKLGFKILVPVVRFLDNWTVKVELIEEKQASNHPSASP